jgi:hypothetical protein
MFLSLIVLLAFGTVPLSALPIETSYASSAPCSGLYTASGFVGCTSVNPLVNDGALLLVDSRNDLLAKTSLVQNPASWYVVLCVCSPGEVSYEILSGDIIWDLNYYLFSPGEISSRDITMISFRTVLVIGCFRRARYRII